MNLCILLTVIGAAILCWYVAEKIKKYSTKAVILKSLVSTLFMAVAVAAAFSGSVSPYSGFVILGLLFGLLGDIWLDQKFVYPDEDTVYTYAGFCVFGVGHILFMTGMLLHYADCSRTVYIILPLVIGAVIGLGAVLGGPMLKLDFGKFKTISIVYGFLLGSMAAMAGSLAIMHGWQSTTLNLMFIGGVSFLLSDLVLSGTYFGGKERPVDIILNYLFYYGAQFLIAWSLLYV